MTFQLQKIILIFIRITAFIVICPGFSFKGLPNTFKIGFAISLTLIINSIIPKIDVIDNMFLFLLLNIKETILGLALGFVTNLIFSAAEIAGNLVDFQVGFSMASVYDPSVGTTAANYGKMYYWISISVFFLLDMHHKVITALVKSFDYIPLNTVSFNNYNAKAIVSLFSEVFELALNLAIPIIIVVLVTDIILGIISKTVPQINVLMLGMPVKAMVSYIITLLTLSWLINSIGNTIQLIPENLEGFMNLFS
ncbi:flagellar biosynthetic protein FliR [Tissierellaceae bacterium BX21]|uniref:Flagellar biosynthetic protein FliR n=1 Tax=Paratissierella segnis TaxID=2763679 RepID=A0A926ET21_9FIRM|nr:flagellar biosynthetic protein FliR [Paratissierella segnis]